MGFSATLIPEWIFDGTYSMARVSQQRDSLLGAKADSVQPLVLAVIVVVHFVQGLPFSKSALQFNSLLLLFVLAVLANVAYCAAYLPDVFAQMSGLRDSWLRFRWALFVIGLAFAAVLAHFFSLSMFDQGVQ
jgi:uncharacterized membrane protein